MDGSIVQVFGQVVRDEERSGEGRGGGKEERKKRHFERRRENKRRRRRIGNRKRRRSRARRRRRRRGRCISTFDFPQYPIKINLSQPKTSVGKVALSIHCAASSTKTVENRINSFEAKERIISDPAPIQVHTITSAECKTFVTHFCSTDSNLFFASPSSLCNPPNVSPPK